METPLNPVARIWQRVLDTVTREAEAACTHMDVNQLTEGQRFAIAFLAGVRLDESQHRDGKLMLTTEPCGIAVVQGRFQVYTLAKRS